MTQPPGGGLLVIERLLRDRDGIWQQIIEERSLKQLIGQMLASSALSLALYGAVLGASNGWAQALSSFVKLPLLFLATLAICLPTLYLFNLVFGARLSVLQAVTLIMVTITVLAVLTLAFAPISLFFLITAKSYSLFKLLNVAILTLTALIGLRFLTAGMTAFNNHQIAEGAARRRRTPPSSRHLSPPVPPPRPTPARRRRPRPRRPTAARRSRRRPEARASSTVTRSTATSSTRVTRTGRTSGTRPRGRSCRRVSGRPA
jgi:hypothetical protein